MEAIVAMFVEQPWYAMAGEVVIMANAITMFISKHWFKDSAIMGKVVMALDWLSLNIFKNKNLH